jgi:glycosyltransferase involved in cell wall biosynthesis
MIKKQGVSVIIPVWNNAKTIKKAVESCLNQTLLPLEILICDDGSTDESKKVVKSISSPLIRWIEGKHSGKPAIPRNKGIKKSKGEWIAFLDADDVWLPNKLKSQITAMKQTKCLAICTNAYKKKKGVKEKKLFFEFPQKNLTLIEMLKTNFVICSSILLHYTLLKNVVGFPENKRLISVEDYSFFLRIASQTNIIYLNQPLVIYTDEPDKSIRSKIKTKPKLLKLFVLIDFIFWILKI